MFPRSRLLALTLVLITSAVALVFVPHPFAPRLPSVAATPQPASGPAGAATPEEVAAQCGGCHAVPPPDVLPRGAWRDSVARMMLIRDGRPEPVGPIGTAARMVVLPPEMQRVLRYYLDKAPERLPAATPWPEPDASRFTVHGYMPPGDAPPLPAISHVRFADIDRDGKMDILASDMRQGLIVSAAWDGGKTRQLKTLDQLQNPSHVQVSDFDGDGINDLLVADLGTFQPENHTKGSVVWLRGVGSGKYAQLALPNWPRVADVEPGDFNGDGRPDLAVAAFGWRTVGRLSVLENKTTDYSRPSFTEHVLDPRTGGIHTVPVDINGDGRLDIVALIAQQHEAVVAFLNTGNAFAFAPETVYTAPHPNWGSAGIEVMDLDGDKDLDVLMTHGDTFDDQMLKPYHGIVWLENTGSFPFVAHRLADMPGVLRAEAGDIDGDGDLDVVAGAFLAADVDKADAPGVPSLVWLEQTARGVFAKHTLERRPPRHATLDLGDVDGDGDVDILVGNFLIEAQNVPWVEVWENKRR